MRNRNLFLMMMIIMTTCKDDNNACKHIQSKDEQVVDDHINKTFFFARGNLFVDAIFKKKGVQIEVNRGNQGGK